MNEKTLIHSRSFQSGNTYLFFVICNFKIITGEIELSFYQSIFSKVIMNTSKSRNLFEEAKRIIPGGVNSPVRAFKSVGGDPLFITKGKGSKIYDVDDNEFIDYIGSWGPHLFGHNPPFIKETLIDELENGTSFGTPTSLEVEMAKLITELVSSVEMVRMVNSGTEATMSAVRAARGFTGKEKFIKFEGCYHGHADYFLIKAGSGALTLGIPTSPGVTKGNAADTLLADYNNIESVKKLIRTNKKEIAAVIIEPVAGNMGVIKSSDEFLSSLRQICDDENIVLIFDEVMTGFRVSKGGAQELYSINPDLTTFGKIIGGGLPVGAFGGKRKIMEMVAPAGSIYQAGTLSGNPLAMAAGTAVLNHIKNNPGIYDVLENKGKILEEGFKENLKRLGKSYALNRVGSMACMFFTEQPVTDFKSAVSSDTALYGKYFHGMLKRGIYLAPAQFEAIFISAAHSDEDLDKTIKANYETLKSLI
jgi:glutamate-1-semialdehyde 2,1-aminomutase